MEIPNWPKVVQTVQLTLKRNSDLIEVVNQLPQKYQDRRGLMIVDCVTSRQRKYDEYVVKKLLPLYESKAKDLSVKALSERAPDWMPLRDGEAQTMKLVAKKLLKYGEGKSKDENTICKLWAEDSSAHADVLDIKGIGPALLQYLRMLSGANTLKVDVRIIDELQKMGVPVDWFTTDGLLRLCENLAADAGCTLVELDQVLWHANRA